MAACRGVDTCWFGMVVVLSVIGVARRKVLIMQAFVKELQQNVLDWVTRRASQGGGSGFKARQALAENKQKTRGEG